MKLRLLLLALLGLAPGFAQACECTSQPLDQWVRGASLIVVGETMIPRAVVPDGGAQLNHLQVYKGVNLSTAVIANNRPGGDPSCAVQFYLSRPYLVFAYGNYESGYYTDKCAIDVSTDATLLDKIMLRLGIYNYQLEAFLQKTGYIDMQSLTRVRDVAAFYLEMHSSEQAMRYYKQATLLSRGSVIDLQGEGEGYLQLGMAREALTRFDDVLEKDNTRQAAWSGRYKALALMGRWSELPQDKVNLTGFEWQRAKLGADLANPVLAKSWWVQIDAGGRKLTGADFSGAVLTSVSFKGSDLTGANLSNAKLFDVDFTGAILQDVKLSGINYQNVKWPEGFTPPASLPDAAEAGEALVGQQDPAGR